MGVNNFRAEDLNGANLESLILDLRSKLNNGEYADVQHFARDFARKIQGMTIDVMPNGQRTVEVNTTKRDNSGKLISVTERVDLDEAVTKILDVIDESKSVTLTSDQKVQRDAMYVAVDEQLTGLFKQHEMMQELAARGFDPEKFKQANEKANQLSQERIDRYKTELKETEKKRKDVLGEDFDDPDPILCRKSLKTKLENEMTGKAHLENINRSISRIKDLEEAIKLMEDEIAADPTLESRNRGNINANLSEIAQLSTNIDGAVTDIKNLNLPGFDVNSINKCHDKSVMSREDAEKAVRKLLYGSERATAPVYNKGMELRIANAYKEIKDSIESKDKDSYKDIMGKYNDSDETLRKEARKAIDDYMKQLDDKIIDIERKISQEEILKVSRNKSVEEYDKILEKNKTLSDRFEKTTVQATNDSGEPIFVDADGKLTLSDTGTPYMIEKRVPKNATKQEYLNDFDETAKRTAINDKGAQTIEDMTWREKRTLLKSVGVGNFITRLFPNRLVKKELVTILPEVTRDDLAQLEKDKQAHIDVKANVEIGELKSVERKINLVETTFAKTARSAEIQQKMQDGAHEVAQTRIEKPELVDAMETASYDEVALLLANNFLSDNKTYQEARKDYNLKAAANRHASKVGVRDNPNTAVHKNAESIEHDER